MMRAVLSNQDHPEYGQITVSFPIPDAYYDYGRYAEDRMRHESGEFNELGYVSYHGTMTLEELMMEDPAGQYQKEQGLQMGGMA